VDNEKNKRRYCSEGGCPRGKLFASNWLEGISESGDFDVVEVSFKNTRVGFYTNPSALPLRIGDIVAVEGNPGHDIGRVSMVGRLVRMQMRKNGVKADSELKRVFRLATQADMEKFEEARSREHATMIRTRKIAEELELNMKIGDVEYQGDGGKAIFYYIADERVDFRKLIRILADTFKIRVEMKQIGARQEAGRIGGIGPCGRPLCCASWMTHFVSVGTGAARIQDLSMNPQKLAGQCAKLKCCLNFETDVYSEAQKKMPPKDAVLETKDSLYYFFKPDILAGTVTYSTDRRIPANLVTIEARRAFEIMALNKQGVKVDSLLSESKAAEAERPAYVDLVEQESLTRFDKTRKKKKKKSGQIKGQEKPSKGNDRNPGQPDKQPKLSDKQPKAEKTQKPSDGRRNERRKDQRPRKKNQNQKAQVQKTQTSKKNGE
jgi:cell fate regulator YaaT (PSP1 superfamily)